MFNSTLQCGYYFIPLSNTKSGKVHLEYISEDHEQSLLLDPSVIAMITYMQNVNDNANVQFME